MKSTISNTDLLLIRACKRNKVNYNILRRIIAREYALRLSYVNHGDVARCLIRIVVNYELIRHWEEFLCVDLNPKKWWKSQADNKKPYLENLIEQLVSKITCSEVAKFPRYPSPAWFRNKYPQDKA